MNRRVQLAVLIAIVTATASCASINRTAGATPTTPGKLPAKGGPVVSAQAPANAGKCVAGATDEPLSPFWAPQMITETTGWAIGSCTLGAQPSFPSGSTLSCYEGSNDWMGIERTSDGGTTWTDVSPPSVPNRTWHHAQFFLDANHAWVEEVSRNADACASQAITFMTNDGGATWRQGGSVALKLSAPEDDVFNVGGATHFMDFVDPEHGWLTVASPPSHPSGGPGQMTTLTMVYSTADGGMHWHLVATNPGQSQLTASGCPSTFYMPGSDVMFVSPNNGWLAIACPPGGLMLATRDGGATWTARPFPNCTCQVGFPQVFDADHAVLTGIQGSPAMLVTADGGRTWAQRQVPQAAMTQFSFLDAAHGWMVGIAQLPTTYETVVYRTTDGGQNWSLVSKPGFTSVGSDPKAYFPVSGVRFLSDSLGFVVLGGEAGTGGQPEPGVPTLQILKTNDGGRTWNVVLKQVPANSCLATYHQLGYGSIDISPTKMASATTAWARGGLRTTDGGAHWKDVSPPALREGAATALYPQGFTDFYLDGEHAWEAGVYGSKTSCSDHLTTFATSDGGKTWQPSSPVLVPVPKGDVIAGIQTGFSSATAGWLWAPITKQGGMDFGGPAAEGYLYVSADGGLSWKPSAHLTIAQLNAVAPPSADAQNCPQGIDGVTFASPTVGWVNLNCSNQLVTHDAGVTWKLQNPSFGGGMPTFVDPSHGFVQSFDPKGGTNTTLLATSDGGASWHDVGALPSTGYTMAMTFIDAKDIMALVTPPGWTKGSGGKDWLYRSADGGQTWVLVQKDVPLGRVDGFVFSDTNSGMVAQPRNATWSLDTAGYADASDTQMAVTADGGHTWRVFKPAIDS